MSIKVNKREVSIGLTALHSLAVDVSMNFSSPGAPLRAPVFLLARFNTVNVPQKLEAINSCFYTVKEDTLLLATSFDYNFFSCSAALMFGFLQGAHAGQVAPAVQEDRVEA